MALQPGLFYTYVKNVHLSGDILNPYSHSTHRSTTIHWHLGMIISSPFLQERLQMSGGEQFQTLLLPVIVSSQMWSMFRCNGTPMTPVIVEIYQWPYMTIVAHYNLGARSCLPCWWTKVTTFPLPQSWIMLTTRVAKGILLLQSLWTL